MSHSSRISGFYRLPLAERRQAVAQDAGMSPQEFARILDSGGLDSAAADKIVENVLGVYGLPFGLALNFTINDRDHLVPMVVEEPSVVAAASNAAKMVRAAGGFHAQMLDDLLAAQVQLFDVGDPEDAVGRIEAATEELLEIGRRSVPNLIRRGGGPRFLEVRSLGDCMVVVHVLVDCREAMGANLVNSIAEAIGPRAAELAKGQLGLRILSNLCDRRRIKVSCRVNAQDLAPSRTSEQHRSLDGASVVDAIVQASRFAELDPYRAATHNKGIMNGVDSVVMATGNDYRAVEAGAHAYAARSGRYAPLAIWRRDGEQLVGELELPLALGIVGGTLRVHPTARLALQLAKIDSASELAQLAGAAGLASNLAALRALATEGIQRGHMSLHARSVASAAGAVGDEVEHVAAALSETRRITVDNAEALLAKLRKASS